jgi:flagellar hook assembly protein FlgD
VGPVEDLPKVFALNRSRPNPFAGRTSIGFDLPVGSAVNLRVFDAQGRQVRTLVDQAYPAGRHSAVWAGDSDAGGRLSSGIYFLRMEAGNFKATSKVLLMR